MTASAVHLPAGFNLPIYVGSQCVFSGTGEQMPIGDLPGWSLIFTDDFATDIALGTFPGATADGKWTAYLDNWIDTSKRGRYYPSRVVSVHDSMADLYLHSETINGEPKVLVAAIQPVLPKPMLYGRYAIRFRADPTVGFKFVSLLWPDSEVWPRDGEINFPEADLANNIYGFVHLMNGTAPDDQSVVPTTTKMSAWHTAVIEWTPMSVLLFLDGVRLGGPKTRIPSTPMHWVIQAETSLQTVPAPSASAHVYIDWVAAWAYRP